MLVFPRSLKLAGDGRWSWMAIMALIWNDRISGVYTGVSFKMTVSSDPLSLFGTSIEVHEHARACHLHLRLLPAY